MGQLLDVSSIRVFVALTLFSDFKELLVTCFKYPTASKRYLSAEPTFAFSTVIMNYNGIYTKWREFCL